MADATLIPNTIPRLPIDSHRLNPAQWMYERVAKSIIEFEKKLDTEHEVALRLVSFGGSEMIAIDDVGYWGPDMIIFYGTNPDGHSVELLQHTTQLSMLLVAKKKEQEKPRRIGFRLEEKLKDK